MSLFSSLANRFPVIRSTYYNMRNRIGGFGKESTDPERMKEVFEDIFRSNGWAGVESVSGRGSDSDQVKVLVEELPPLLKDLGIRSILDLPCGDFNWMKTIDLEGFIYVGADIVKPIIENNTRLHVRDGVSFMHLDLIHDDLPKADLILNRDCLIHFSNADVFKALRNICRSGSDYLLTTTFTEMDYNKDITTGRWRMLNLCAPPFNLPKPQKSIFEHKNKKGYRDKTLSLWKVSDIARRLKA